MLEECVEGWSTPVYENERARGSGFGQDVRNPNMAGPVPSSSIWCAWLRFAAASHHCLGGLVGLAQVLQQLIHAAMQRHNA